MGFSLGSDKLYPLKEISVLGYLFTSVFLLWALVNTPANFNYVLIYSIMMVIFFVAHIYDTLFKKAELVDTVIEEPPKLRPIPFLQDLKTWQHALIIFAICGWVFFSVSTSNTLLISAPTFQIAEFTQTPLFKSILMGLAGIPETLFFFCFMFPSFFTMIASRTNSKEAGFILAMLFTTTVFTGFHFFVYGTENLVASTAVFVYGIRECVWIYLFRSAALPIAEHFTNNFAASWFSTHVVGALI